MPQPDLKPAPGGKEQRGDPRTPLDAKVSYSLDARQWFTDRSINISRSGMLICSIKDAKPGDSIVVRFHLPNVNWPEPLTATGEVVRLTEGQTCQGVGLGIRFQSLDTRNEAVLADFLRRVLGESAVARIKKVGDAAAVHYSFEFDKLAHEAMAEMGRGELARGEAMRRAEIREASAARRNKALLTAAKVLALGAILYFAYQAVLFFSGRLG